MLRKYLSYLIPFNILKIKSEINKSIEVTWNNGHLVLDTENTNFSYGSLQRILKKGLQNIGFDTIKTFENILILGVAGGSVVKTLVNDIKFNGRIVGVELDEEIIKIANEYFDLDKIGNLEIINDNAENFVKKDKNNYDLIIIDIFQDNFMPEFLFETEFLNNVVNLLNQKGFIIFNTMILSTIDHKRNFDFISNFDQNLFKIRKISNLEQFNELIIIEKL